jgi:hypothetical protein
MQSGSVDASALFTSLDSFLAAITDPDNATGVRALAQTIGSLCRDKST